MVLEALSMLIMAILIILILIGLGEAGSAAADEIANGKYEMDGSHGSEWSKTAESEIFSILWFNQKNLMR